MDRMTGKDLIEQETYEQGFERAYVDNLDRVDRRDRRGEIVSSVVTDRYRTGFDRIWTVCGGG